MFNWFNKKRSNRPKYEVVLEDIDLGIIELELTSEVNGIQLVTLKGYLDPLKGRDYDWDEAVTADDLLYSMRYRIQINQLIDVRPDYSMKVSAIRILSRQPNIVKKRSLKEIV